MTTAQFINKLLAPLGIKVVRTASQPSPAASRAAPPGCIGTLAGTPGPGHPPRIEDTLTPLLQHQIASKWHLIDTLEALRANPLEHTCPLCRHRAQAAEFALFVSACIFGGGELVRYQCPRCDVIFGPDKMLRLTGAALSNEYEWHYRVYSEGDSTEQELRAFHSLAPRREGIYLNWGAGSWSTTLQILRAEGWNVHGYEPHESAADPGTHIISNPAALAAMHFDGIFSNNVLEHLRYPAATLIEMRERLKPGGIMAHATPCFEYRFEFTRFHLFFFLGRSRQLLAGQAGLRVLDFSADGDFMNLRLAPALA